MNTPKLKKAENLEEIHKFCRPMPLKPDELEAFFIETDSARNSHQNPRERIKKDLKAIPNARILFYGHRGCGKSTELSKLSKEIQDNFFTVSFSIMEEMNLNAVRAEDLILIIAERILNAAQEQDLKLKDTLLNPVLDYFSETVLTKNERHTIGTGVKALLGLFVKLNGEIKYNAYNEESKTAHLRKRPADLLGQTNNLIEAVKDALPEGKDLLVIVEDLDKIDLKQARDIYVQNAGLLTGIKVNIIYTIPVFLFHSPDVGAFQPLFDDTISFPMIKVCEPSDKRAEGFETVRSIILKRVEDKLIKPDALDLLIEKTGGVLRHVFEVLKETSLMATASVPLSCENIRYGLDQLRIDLSRQIALPYDSFPDSPQSVEKLYELLTIYTKKQQKNEFIKPKSDTIHQILIRSCALVEYNGKQWIGVHPLVREFLEALGRL
jgi:hypothetical protein